MEFFALVNKTFKTQNFINQCFSDVQSRDIVQHDLGGWNLYYSEKSLGINQLVVDKISILVVTGTIIYKNLNAADSLAKVKEELDANKINTENWYGNFGIVYARQGDIRLIVDPFAVQSIFSDLEHQFYSSSFILSQLLVGDEHISLNKLALTESIVTGNLIGPDTLFNEINRFEPYLDWNINDKVKIEALNSDHNEIGKKVSYEKALNLQIENVESTFLALSNFANDTGIDSGITSGLDSRLLLAFMHRDWDKFQLHTHYRNYASSEVSIAQKVAQATDANLIMESVRAPDEKTENELVETMTDAFLFTDGIIRMHGFWYEDYNTANHRTKVLGEMRAGISGIGGEQFRNMDQLVKSKINLKEFIKYYWIYALSGNSVSNKKDENELIDRITDKIRSKLNLEKTNDISILEVKRIWNEVFIPARLGGRNNAENKISYFFSPFILSQVSTVAYQAIPHLGHSYSFQIDMLKKISPKLAKIPSDYGFDFMKKQPKSLYWKALYNSYTPAQIKFALRERKIQRRGNNYYKKIISELPILSHYVNQVKELGLPLNYDKLEMRSDLTPMIMNVGYLLAKSR